MRANSLRHDQQVVPHPVHTDHPRPPAGTQMGRWLGGRAGHAGNLVSNAPHLPVHLGGRSEAVKFQIQNYRSGGGAAEGLQVRGDTYNVR